MNDRSRFAIHKAGIHPKPIEYYRIRDEFRETIPRPFLFFRDHMETKYVWDIVAEKNLSKRQVKMANVVSTAIVYGGNVRDVQRALKCLNFPVK